MGTSGFKNFLILVENFLGLNGPLDLIRMVVDIGLVSYIIYKVIHLVRETRAMQLVKGIVIILVGTRLTELIGLRTISYILQGSLQLMWFILIVLFQPELRRGLEKVGSSGFRDLISIQDQDLQIRTTQAIEDIVKACRHLSEEFIGALIVIERDTKIGDIINTGTRMNSDISYELLVNIFTPNTLLHDGAVIVRDNKIMAAACYLPLTENANLSKELGTRHRAALGITEVSDAVSIVVSEESGKISYANNGGLTRNLTPDTLRKALYKFLLDKDNQKRRIVFRKVKSSEQAN